MKKRGGISLLLLSKMGMILFLIVFFLIIGAGKIIVDEARLARLATARDIGLLVDTTQSTPYDVVYEYPTNLLNTHVIVENNVVTIVDVVDGNPEPKESFTTKYFFTLRDDITFEQPILIESPFFAMYKEESLLRMEAGFANEIVDEQTTATQRREAISFQVISRDEDINAFATLLESELMNQDFTIVSEDPTHIIYLGEQEGLSSSITYSALDARNTKALADRFLSVMQGSNLPVSEIVLSNSYTKSNVEILFNEGVLEINNQQLLSQFLVEQIGEYYVK